MPRDRHFVARVRRLVALVSAKVRRTVAATQAMAWKLAYTAFTVLIVVVWLRHYGWRNLLWWSDIALIGAVPGLWLNSSTIASVLAVAVMLPELLWNVDFAMRLLLRRRVTGLTDYMFERERPLLLRRLSLFHVPLPLVLIWMLHAYGYDATVGLPGAVLLAAIVLPWSRLVSSPERNINWTHGLGASRSPWPAPLYVAALFAGYLLLVFVPTHHALQALFPAAAD